MSNILILNQSFVTVGLGTLTYTVPTAGVYNVAVVCNDTPNQAVNPSLTPNQVLSIVVNQNGTPVYTAPILSPTQTQVSFKTDLLCAAADVITVVTSSSAPAANMLNTVKSSVFIGTGQ